MNIPDRVQALRSALKANGCDAFIIPSSDPHASEYAPAHFTAWQYYSGFPCENSKFVVTEDWAGLWVDGRFYGAADAALAGTGIDSMHMGTAGVPETEDWLAEHLSAGMTLGYNAGNMPLRSLRLLERKLEGRGVCLKACMADDEAWGEERPALPATEAWILDKQYAGLDTAEKLSAFRAALPYDAAVLTALDSIAWLLNLRAWDVEDTPYALAFCYVEKDCCVLFINEARVPANVRQELEQSGVELRPYEGMEQYLREIRKPVEVLVDPARTNASLYLALSENPACTIREAEDPVQMLKAVKNPVELECTRKAHLRDAAAMVRFEMELEKRMHSGEQLRETDIDEILHRYRSQSELFLSESFGTIAAYGANAAMMHYAPQKGKDAVLQPKGYLLVDCGGTYLDGTTDITRTYPLGPLTDWEKEAYTLVLRCHIDTAMAVWMAGMTGGQLDMISRQPLWHRMLNYRCGTGHSVGHVAAVHEGPHSLRYTNQVVFEPGMVVTDEPGIYEEGIVGIRIENELVCVEAGESEYGRFLKFEPIMYVPIDMEPVKTEMLSQEEKEWINNYHALVFQKISPLLNEEEKGWLQKKCVPIQ